MATSMSGKDGYMDPEAIIVKVTDGHTKADRCSDCKRFIGQHFFLHCYSASVWLQLLHNPSMETFYTKYDEKKKDKRSLVYEGQPPIKLTTVPQNCWPLFVISAIDNLLGKDLRILCTVWTIKP